MNKKRISHLQWKIKSSIQRLHRRYHKYPHIFLTEADIQCNLFSELIKSFNKPRKVDVRDSNWKKLNDWQFEILTPPIHIELSSSRRKRTEYVDLCIVEPSETLFRVKKTKFNKAEKRVPLWGYEWYPKKSIGIEIKFNWDISSIKAFSNKTGRWRVTKNWINVKRSLMTDLIKLKRYKRGWLIFVDQHSLIGNKKEWRELMKEVIRNSNYGRAKKTLHAYYLCPKLKTALPYRPYTHSF